MTSTELTSVDMKPAFWNHRSVCYCVMLRWLDFTWKFWLMTEFVYLIKCLASRKAKELERKNHLEVRRVNHSCYAKPRLLINLTDEQVNARHLHGLPDLFVRASQRDRTRPLARQ